MKTIFITGASSGIGRETAKFFAAKGWRVIVTMRNLKILAEYDVDVLLNNAGYGIMAPFERIPEAEIRKLFETDVFGTMFVTQEFIPHFKARRSGAILTTTSLAAIIGLPRDGAYGAAKRAQQGMVESLYYELKPFNVFVKAMIPGGTKTNFQTPLNDLTGYEKNCGESAQISFGGQCRISRRHRSRANYFHGGD